MTEKPALVSVIIPTFNRGHLLEETIPTFLQPEVGEIILIDDASTDDTEEVGHWLVGQYPRIRYFRNEKNIKQTGSKNRGIQEAQFPYIYFGDDDCYLMPGAMSLLLQVYEEQGAQLCGARALFMPAGTQGTPAQYWEAHQNDLVSDPSEIVNLNLLKFNFQLGCAHPIEFPVLHACFLINTADAKKVSYHTGYIGNSFREETDYTLRCKDQGMKLVYCSQTAQVNLPPERCSGGSRSTKWKYEYYSFVNNFHFLKRNESILRALVGPSFNKYVLQWRFFGGRFTALVQKLFRF
jgi:glycosyltransferase involved in cell wall biosynthesis